MFIFRPTYSLFLHHLQINNMQNMNIENTRISTLGVQGKFYCPAITIKV